MSPLTTQRLSTMTDFPSPIEPNTQNTNLPVTPPSSPPLVLPSSPTSVIFQAYPAAEIPDAVLEQCSVLFSNNYGIWGQSPANVQGPKPG